MKRSQVQVLVAPLRSAVRDDTASTRSAVAQEATREVAKLFHDEAVLSRKVTDRCEDLDDDREKWQATGTPALSLGSCWQSKLSRSRRPRTASDRLQCRWGLDVRTVQEERFCADDAPRRLRTHPRSIRRFREHFSIEAPGTIRGHIR